VRRSRILVQSLSIKLRSVPETAPHLKFHQDPQASSVSRAANEKDGDSVTEQARKPSRILLRFLTVPLKNEATGAAKYG
jgi:hypothetical protein